MLIVTTYNFELKGMLGFPGSRGLKGDEGPRGLPGDKGDKGIRGKKFNVFKCTESESYVYLTDH